MKVGVVMPVGPGRIENVMRVIGSLEAQESPIEAAVLVLDGYDLQAAEQLQEMLQGPRPFPVMLHANLAQHHPGQEQPRNVGVRLLREFMPVVDHAWFVDSDVIVDPDAHAAYHRARAEVDEDRVLIGPYDWLPTGHRDPNPGLKNDPRWVSFDRYAPTDVLREDLSAGLACFSGNLVWPIERFEQVGGFWSEIHHGRCEDGELGLRAVALGVPISYVRDARGWHLWHPVNMMAAQERNARDVPMINERHPWVQGEGLHVVPLDGRRFNVRCGFCQASVNTLDWWQHAERCGGGQ